MSLEHTGTLYLDVAIAVKEDVAWFNVAVQNGFALGAITTVVALLQS